MIKEDGIRRFDGDRGCYIVNGDDYDKLEAENKRLREALTKSADTFDDLNRMLRLFGRETSAEACRIAGKGCRDVLDGGASHGGI